MNIIGTSGDDDYEIEDLEGEDLFADLGDGNDSIWFYLAEQSVSIYGGNGNDAIGVRTVSHMSGQTLLDGGAGNDSLYAYQAGFNPILRGGTGNDDYTITNPDQAILVENAGEGRDSVYVFMTD